MRQAANKMKNFNRVLKEINKTLTQLSIFENLVNSTIVFLVSYLIFSFFGFHFLYSLVPTFTYLVFYTYMSMKRYNPSVIESKYSPLREKLRTAADNVKYDNPIIDELEYEVTSEMKNVGISLFINPKTISYKIFAATLLSFLIIFSSTLNIKFESFSQNKFPDIFQKAKGAGNFIATKLENSNDIYGNDEIAKLGDNELSIKIRPVDFKVSVKEEGSLDKKDFETIFPQDVVVKESAAFEENIAQEDQELVKNYFKKLAS